ncbi:diguanylate cyclase (GGDEF) domain-containing protein [Desulfitobacterium dichloroeliminans LMG P-21439]|uniref:Diguanylate cyclase (GGDEF) domain-containing protein n=1 Tax=Desulfitobacterium dichloroeliminans (strain LMG P-21439 / DCA1) TaxID=871963 RepID=L0F941_DESDL|nr:diguanylate cyclase [Desulfitobacterium dichloroeliminans]AGA70354.1 diguanylate cyclase (GGDEF) domain-containing protein [Desulfitobacterium dichloroeliminans LMG P-21439]
MPGKIGELIDKIIEDRAKGNSAIAEMTKAELILKGIYSDKYDNNCSDEPEILEKLINIRNQWNCKELNKDGCNFKLAFSKGDTEGEVILDIQSQLSNCNEIKFSSNILENMKVRLLKSGDIVQETQKAIEEKKQALGKRLTGILSFDCLYRRLELDQKQKDIVEEYGEIFKSIFTVGCYTYGEVNIGYMNQTSNMLIFEYEDRGQSETQDDYDYVYNNDNQRLTEANRKLEGEVANLRHKLEMATQELKIFNIMLEEDITGRTEREEYIKHLCYHDELTGLYNRRFYEEAIKRLDNVNNLPISIIIGDVNNLKMINDTLGHAKGDEILQKSAIALKESCRGDDIIVRFGGDEFVILLPQTSQEKAEKIVKRIGECSSKQFVSDVPVSISLGSDTKENTDKSIAEVFNNAENLMYKQKMNLKHI